MKGILHKQVLFTGSVRMIEEITKEDLEKENLVKEDIVKEKNAPESANICDGIRNYNFR